MEKKILISKAQKLSGLGFSLNERLLKFEGNILSYYSHVQKTFQVYHAKAHQI